MTEVSGTTEIGDEGIKKHFRSIEPYQTVFELVWNGFDAHANNINVNICENELRSVVAVSVLDDGDGIALPYIQEAFGKFNESNKRENHGQHGFNGRGRLAFHRLCDHATWYTKSSHGQAKIWVHSTNIKKYNWTTIDENHPQHASLLGKEHGTCVELKDIHTNLPIEEEVRNLLSTEFGWYIALNSERNLTLNNKIIPVPEHELHEIKVNGEKFDFNVKIIRWENRPSSEKSNIYLLDTSEKIVFKQLSTFNNKPHFHTSIYVTSAWADGFDPNGSSLFAPNAHNANSEEWRNLLKQIGGHTQKIYDDFLRKLVDAEIQKYEEDGIFPSYVDVDPSYARWREGNTKAIIKAIYTADPSVFNSLNKKQKKVIVRLLDKLAISNENDSLLEVMNGVLELDSTSMNTLAQQLRSTTLENIVSTIEVIKRRQCAVNKIKELMNVHYKDVLETPDLQQIIENNTWLFGHRYETLGAEEDTFTKIAKSLRDTIPSIDDITQDDLEDETELTGAKRQTDLFLARKMPYYDSFGRKIYRCIVIEIKRPSVALNVKHLRQLDDYAAIIKKHPEFSGERTHFELILLGRRISSTDTEIASRMKGQVSKGEVGLVSDDDRMKRYVLNWYTLLDGFELSNSFMLEKLMLKRDSLTGQSKDDLVEDLKTITQTT